MRKQHSMHLILVIALLVGGVVWPGSAAAAGVAGTWAWQNPKPQGNALADICVILGAEEGWAVGEYGTILHTVNGSTWTPQQSTVTDNLNAVAALDNGGVWAVGDTGVMCTSSDNGTNWSSDQPYSDTLRDVTMVYGGHGLFRTVNGWAVGDNGRILHTTNGVDWTAQVSNTSNDLYGVYFADGNNGWAVGENETVCRTTDGGDTWTASDAVPTGSSTLKSVVFSGGYGIAGGSGEILKTTDSGAHWTDITPALLSGGVSAVGFGPSSRLVAVTSVGDFWTSDDGGANWDYISGLGSGASGLAVFAGNASHMWVVGAAGRVLASTNGGDSFSLQTAGNRMPLQDVDVIDANNAWALGDTNYPLHTTDGGTTWNVCTSSGTLASLRGIDFYDLQHGWLVGTEGKVLRTTDGGTSWTPYQYSSPVELLAVSFPTASDGWAVGKGGAILHSTDGGATWSAQISHTTEDLYDVHFGLSTQGYAVGNHGTILATTDGGTTWTPQYSGITAPFSRVFSFPGLLMLPRRAWAVAGGGIYHTGDGSSWLYQGWGTWSGYSADEALTGVSFVDSTHGWIAGTRGEILRTADGGTTWVDDATITSNDLFDVGFADKRTGWAVGEGGTILKYAGESVPPVTTMVPLPGAGWMNTDFSFQLTADDGGGSGVTQTHLSYPGVLPGYLGSGYVYGGGTRTVSLEGQNDVHYWSADDNGNTETEKVAVVRIDKTAPVTTCDAAGTFAGPITAHLSATDALSGVASTSYSLDGGAWASGASVAVTKAGAHTLKYRSTDAAGNTEGDKTASFTITTGGGTPGAAVAISVAGATRIDTAIAASRAAFSSADAVVIATAFNFPDALGGSSLAGALNAPLLLTNSDSVPYAVREEIKRLGAKKAYILGSDNALGTPVVADLAPVVGANVKRIGGPDRYATAALIAQETAAVLAAKGRAFDGTVYVATGENFPDALAASPLAAAKCRPILLTRTAALPAASADALTALKAKNAVLLGSASAVSDGVKSAVAAKGVATSRLAGANRYQTAIAVAKVGVAEGLKWDGVALATGANYPDALAGGVMCGKAGSVMLLTDPASLTPDVRTVLATNKATIGTVRFLGSPSAVSVAVREAAMAALK